ncbi:MAG: SIR2 family protein [Prevotella sp.]|nr:SIR2 family protein [Prevotella sp.]
MESKDVIIEEYSKEIENGTAAVFAGAGLSIVSGYVNWKGLLAIAAKELGVTITDNTNLVDLAQYYENATGNRNGLSEAISNEFQGKRPNENHEILASMPIRSYWTTNYDNLIEQALEDAQKRYDPKVDDKSLAISCKQCTTIVYKMHGDITSTADCVLSRNDFEDYPNTHKAFLNALGYDMANKCFLFIGLSMDDPNLHYIFGRVRQVFKRNQRRHFYVTQRVQKKEGESDGDFAERITMQKLFVDDLKRYNIQTVLVDNYSEITEILRSIRSRFLRHYIFISGAAAEYGRFCETDTKKFIRELSADIISKGKRIVTGFGLGIGNDVISGAISQLNKEGKPIDGNLVIYPFPQGGSDIIKMWNDYRKEMISKCGVSLFLLGNKRGKEGNIIQSEGMATEYEIAKDNNNFLIPVGATGYMSKELWKSQMKDISTDPQYKDFMSDIKALGDDSLSLDGLKDVILNILTKI